MKASIAAASAALIGSVAASQHRAHPAFHNRHYAEDVCTVYTTVYVTASELAPVVANSTIYVVPSPVSTPCSESSAPIYIPEVSSTEVAYTPVAPSSTEAAYTPPAYTPAVPAYTPPAYTPAVPAYSAPAYSAPAVPAYSAPAYSAPAAPASSAPAYSAPAAPASSAPAYSAPAVPAYSAPAYSAPAAPAYSAPAYSAPAPKISKEAYTPAPAYTPVPVPSKAAPKPKPSNKPSKPSKPSSNGSYSQTGRIVTRGNKWAMTYTPYAESGDCKTAEEVKSDIAKIASMGFTTIRSYSTDCGVFENVVRACQEHGIKVIFGIFLTGGGANGKGCFSSYADEQLQAIIKGAPKDIIAMMIVGNEFLFNGYGTAEELGSYIDHVRETMIAAGFPSDIAVTTTEPVAQWLSQGKALCSHIDVFACQIHPFFSTQVSASEAGSFAVEQLALASAVCPEAAAKGEYITEIGWPHSGDANGNAIPGYSQQKEAMKNILENVGSKACIFSFQDDKWKNPGALNVEQSFGCSGAL